MRSTVNQTSSCGVVVRHACLSSWEIRVQSLVGPRGLKIIEEKELLCIEISKWLDFRVFSDKDVKIVGISDPLTIGQ
jgi:hypothetical protein